VAQCTPPFLRPPVIRGNGIIDLAWVHPQYFCDTLRAHLGNYVGPFFVTETYPDNRVAIKLPSCSTAIMLHAITAYFIGKPGVIPGDWSIHATFSWSLHADSEGVPGSAIYPETTWLIGDSASLQWGGLFRRTVNWWLPPAPAGVASSPWLVGRWPDMAREVVRLGADKKSCPLPTLIGYSDDTGPQWLPHAEPGLLIEAELLHSQPVASETLSTADGFTVVRELLSGPLSPRADTATLSYGDPLVWHDSLSVVGQQLRYCVAAPCSTGDPVTACSPDFTIQGRLPAELSPETLAVQIRSIGDTTVFLSIHNQGPESLLVQILPVSLTGMDSTPGSPWPDSVRLSPSPPDSLTLAPGEIRAIGLSVSVTDLSTRAYTAWLIARIGDTEGLQVERQAALIRLDVDLPTSVNDGRDRWQGSTNPQRGSDGPDLVVSVGPNPFEDRVAIAWETHESPIVQDGILQFSIADRTSELVDVIVYNSLGHKMKALAIPSRTSLGNQADRTAIVIDGTQRWPSGVYLVSVRRGNQSRTVKLLHLK
jgi:hypothetical protein